MKRLWKWLKSLFKKTKTTTEINLPKKVKTEIKTKPNKYSYPQGGKGYYKKAPAIH